MSLLQGQAGLSYHVGSQLWVPQVEAVSSLTAADNRKKVTSWHRATVQAIADQPDAEPQLTVALEDGARVNVNACDCFLQNERDDVVDDLVRSDFLHEPGILHTLKVRYGMDSIYTYSGQILIATNPHKRLKHLYGPRMMGQYRGVALGELSPHVYAIAEAAYAAMMADEQRQAILISGESGAGKTESAKMVMQYLAHRAGPTPGAGALVKSTSNAGAQAAALVAAANGGAVSAPIEEQVLESNPLLEAFGNAKTARNDNSSRFGKFVEIDFDAAGRVTGAAISTYLLERSRVVSIRSPERSFHIFYQLCAGADDALRAELRLGGGARAFRSLTQSDAFELEDVDDGEAFAHTLDAMRIVGMSDDHIAAILRAVAAVLHLGNVEFEPSPSDEAQLAGSASEEALNIAAELLSVPTDALLAAVTTRAIETRGERIIKVLDATAAAESRDSLSKTLYSRLFDWLVAAVNRKIGAIGGGGRTARSIGILDIYGFECFDRNSFEQLCINLANEKLQQAFNAHVFKGEQAEYAAEGIAWSYVDFVDNQDVLDLLEGGAGTPEGVFPLIDEACRLPRATHADLAHALRTRLAAHPRFGTPRRDQHSFAVEHYAGEVAYSTVALLDKNRDFVVTEHAAVMARSEAPLLQELFGSDRPLEGSGGSGTVDGPADGGKRRSGFMLASVGSRFRRQLGGLMGTLGECQPHFIRCIKPNSQSAPGAFAPPYVVEQLRAGGVLEAVRIACAGFPTRKPFLPFAQRFAVLLGIARLRDLGLPLTPTGFVDWYAASDEQVAEVVRRVLKTSGVVDGWQMGRTRVFLRSGQLAQLEGARGRLLAAAALTVQAAWRGRDARMQLARARAAASRIQLAWRAYVLEKEAARLRKEAGAVRVQTAWRRHAARSAFLVHQRNVRATTIQAAWRRHQARVRFLEETEAGRRAVAKAEEEARCAAAATTIQASWRRVLAQRQVAVLRKQAARVKALQAERDALAAERAALAAALAEAEARAATAEADAAAKAAHIATLESEVESAAAEVEAARADVAAAATASVVGATAAQEAAAKRSADLEVAHKKALAAVREELEVARRQKVESDERAAAAEEKLRVVQAELDGARAELARGAAAAEEAETELAAAKDQVLREKREREEARLAAEAVAAAAAVAAAMALKQAEERGTAAAAAATKAAAAEADVLKRQLAETEAKASRNAASLRDAQEKSSQLAARVEALAARAERLESDARATAAREESLRQELENTRRAAATRVRAPSPLAMAGPPAVGSPAGTPLRRTIAQELEAAATDLDAASPARVEDSTGDLIPAHSALVTALTEATVFQRLPAVEAWRGADGALAVPQAAWLVHRCLLQWAREWRAAEVAAAAHHVESSIAAAVLADHGLHAAGYWLAASLATGALLKMRVVGKPDLNHLFKLADDFIGLTDLHIALGAAVADEVPINVALLLSEDAKRSARRRSTARMALAPVAANGGAGFATPNCTPAAISTSPSSPADLELANMGTAERHWRAVLGGIANVVDALRAEGVPAAAVRAVVWATLRYVDGELLNALLLRRDCCSVSAAKALQTGLAALQNVASFVGAEWGCAPDDAARALERSGQAARFLVQGKDDCARKAQRGISVLPDLTRQCPALTLQQVHRLAEHQHDDWLAGAGSAMGTQTLVLLETLRRLMRDNQARLGGGAEAVVPPSPVAPTPPGAAPTPSKWVAFGDDDSGVPVQEVDEEDLLVDPVAPFELFKMHHPVTRKLLTEAARSFVVAPIDGSAAVAPVATPNGTLPQLSPVQGDSPTAAAPRSPAPSGLSLLDAIDQSCSRAGIPEGLSSNAAFEFLAA